MAKLIQHCPSCGSPMVITRLSCTNCDTEVTGRFHTSVFAQLSDEDLQFVEMFVACRGNVKEVERETGLSYWTIRGKLNDIVQALNLDSKKPSRKADVKAKRQEILAALQRGEISVTDAEVMLADLKSGHIADHPEEDEFLAHEDYLMDDQTTILNMLKEGKISVEEAERLLSLLDDEGDTEEKPKRGVEFNSELHGDEESEGSFSMFFRSPHMNFNVPIPEAPKMPMMPPIPTMPQMPRMPHMPMPPHPPSPPHPVEFSIGGRKRKRKMGEHWTIRTSDLLAAMQQLGYEDIDIDDLQRLRDHGVTPDYIYALVEAGMNDLDVEEIIQLRNHGVKVEFVHTLRAAGYNLDTDEFIALANHGVSAKFLMKMGELGFEKMSVDDMIRLSSNGVSPGFISAFREAGLSNLSIDDLITLSSNGVSSRFVIELTEHGFEDLTVDDLVSLSSNGVSSRFIRAVHEAGFDHFTIDELIGLANHGVSSRFLAQLADHGLNDFTADEIIHFVSHGIKAEVVIGMRGGSKRKVTLESVEAMRARGDQHPYINKLTRQILGLRQRNDAKALAYLRSLPVEQFSVEFAQAIQGLGLGELNVRQMVDMWAFGITLDDVKAGQDASGETFALDTLIQSHMDAAESADAEIV